MDRSNKQRIEDKVLNENSLRNSVKVIFDKNKLTLTEKVITGLLKKVIDIKSVNHIIDFHKVHVTLLISILYNVKKMEPILKEIESIEANINNYVKKADQLFHIVREFPKDPLEEIRNPIMLMQSLEDPEVAKIYDNILNKYEETVQILMNELSEIVHQGRAMENTTREHAQLILNTLKEMPTESQFEQVLIGASKRRIEFVQLDLMTKVQYRRSQAELLINQIKPLLDLVQRIDRVNP